MFEFSWQDVVLTIGNIVFFIALIPSIMSANKPSKWTSLMTASALTAFGITYFSLSLTYATIAVSLSAIGWWVLYFQKR